MNFSSLAGCALACRFSFTKALPSPKTDSELKKKKFIYSSLLHSSYKQIIERHLPGARIIYGDANGKFVFEYRGVKESIHAVAVINDVPYLVKVILVNEPVSEDTLPIKYQSALTSLQALMAVSGTNGRPTIEKSILIAVDTLNYDVEIFDIESDAAEQESISMKIDFIQATDRERIPKSDCSQCPSCDYLPICDNSVLPVVSCTTCAFYSGKGVPTCGLGNNVGVKCPQHIYNPLMLVNHEQTKIDVQNLYVEYDSFINCNSDMGFKPSLTSDEMRVQHQFDNGNILDKNLNDFKKIFGAKPVPTE